MILLLNSKIFLDFHYYQMKFYDIHDFHNSLAELKNCYDFISAFLLHFQQQKKGKGVEKKESR